MFEQANVRESRSAIVDWILRGVIALAFVLFGVDKFPSDRGGPWVRLFQEIGAGQWFRHFTGVVEIVWRCSAADTVRGESGSGAARVHDGFGGVHSHVHSRASRRYHRLRRHPGRTGRVLVEPPREVKYTTSDDKTHESIMLWDLTDGEMVINTKNWEKTHGFGDCITADATPSRI